MRFGVEVRRARPDELALCFEVRRRVFIDEQGVTEEIEIDGLDRSARTSSPSTEISRWAPRVSARWRARPRRSA